MAAGPFEEVTAASRCGKVVAVAAVAMSTSLYRRVLARRFIAVPANCAKSLAVCNTASSDMASLDMRQRHLHVGICRDVNIVGRYRGRNGKVRSFANDNKSFQSILNKIKDDNSSDSSAKKEDDNGASTSSTAGEKKATEAGAESDSNTADSPKSASTDASSSFNMDPKDLLQKASILARESYAKVLDNVKLAWLEMTQRDSADGVLSKKVHQAASFKGLLPRKRERRRSLQRRLRRSSRGQRPRLRQRALLGVGANEKQVRSLRPILQFCPACLFILFIAS